jgi:thioredoxin reductase
MQAETQEFDAIIVGGGPAGVSCAVWLARLGLAPLLVEAGAQIGGLCRSNPFYDEWNATLPGMTGPQVADNLALSLEQAAVPVLLSCPVKQIQRCPQGFAVTRGSGATPLVARYLVLASGVKACSLPELDRAARSSGQADRVLTGPGEHIVAHDFRDKRVAILGGGDNAFENALYALGKGASAAHIYARHVRAQQQFVRQVSPANIAIGPYKVDVEALRVNDRPYDVLLVFYGWEPCVDFADNLALDRSVRGFLDTHALTAETSCAGVYAIGEVAQRQHPCVVTALADGVTAAKAIQARIENQLDADRPIEAAVIVDNWR